MGLGALNPFTLKKKTGYCWNALMAAYLFSTLDERARNEIRKTTVEIESQVSRRPVSFDELSSELGTLGLYYFYSLAMANMNIMPKLGDTPWFKVSNPRMDSFGAEELYSATKSQLENQFGIRFPNLLEDDPFPPKTEFLSKSHPQLATHQVDIGVNTKTPKPVIESASDTRVNLQVPPPQPGSQPSMRILGMYMKDLSFENPNAPQALAPQQSQPDINIAVNVNARNIAPTDFEVELHFDAKATSEGKVMFASQVLFAGVFRMENFVANMLHAAVLIECPRMLFPFARQILADATRNGGFPPLMLDPVDFAGMYQKRMAAQVISVAKT